MQRLIAQSCESAVISAEELLRMMIPTSRLHLSTLLISRAKTSASSDEDDPLGSAGSRADDVEVHEASDASSSDEDDRIPQPKSKKRSQAASTSGAVSAADSAAAEAAEAATPPRGHISLDHPLLNIYLRHNTKFVTDPDRGYLLGQANALDKKTRLELLKALAAQRLQLKDAEAAAAAAGRQEPHLHQQMVDRLAEMQGYWSDKAQQ